MRVITGDECGLLKESIPELSRRSTDPDAPATPYNAMPDVTKDGVSRIDPKEKQTRERGVVDLAWRNDAGCEQFSFAALRKNGSVELWKAAAESRNKHANYVLVQTSKNIFQQDRPNPLGLGVFCNHNRICAGDSLGNVVVLKNDSDLLEEVQTYNAYKGSKRGETLSYTRGQALNTQLATAIAFDTSHGRVAVGGRERETCLIDIHTGVQVFKTKNLPPDPQTLLQQPVWPTAIQFLHNDMNTMAVGTAYKQVRLYDVRESSKIRRPTQTTPEDLLEYRVTSLCQVSDYELVVADGAGYIYCLDLRRLGRDLKAAANKDMGRYVGPAGSVRQLKKHPTLPRLAAVGLDRMLRIYDTKKRRQLDCIYLKQRINCVLVHGDDTWDFNDATVDVVDPDDLDIDQDDVVQEYVDSDEEGSHGDDSNEDADSVSSDDSEGNDEEAVDGSHEDGGESVEDNDVELPSSHQRDSKSQCESSDNEDSESHSSETSSEESKDNSEAEEDDEDVIVVKAPKRRRRQ
ncbi:hypothetical protein IV203_019563 [Nitzschia inconspicua]|uniref:Ribosome biogenesis protein NSA1 n=1 Tax=Nitzschia inconspicua TaxID=303405 RepID=A0A9K3Q4M5_9STRA|nr:hypothetical protein IV203_019563 [Nitzschia inconspicua]